MPSTTYRQTGLIARLVDDNLNSWEDWAGYDINIDVVYGDIVGASEIEQSYWGYRGQAAVCQIANGNIIRVRIGDGTPSDRTIYRQIVTDPTSIDQWTTWSQLYTGDHYAIAIEADPVAGAGYRVYHAKSDGLYVDNTKKVTKTNIIRIKPTHGAIGLVYFRTVEQDAVDSGRAVRWWYTPDINAGSPTFVEDCTSYRWYRQDMAQIIVDMGEFDYYFRFRSMVHTGGARNQQASQILTSEQGQYLGTSHPQYNEWNNVRFLKGPSEQSGYKVIENLYITSLYASPWNSAFYLFYNERHFALDGLTVLSNRKNPLFWSRAVGNPTFLSAPVPVGYSIWGFAGVVEFGPYVYLCGNGRVLRRPRYEEIIEMTDYVIEGNYDLPRDNQKATGRLLCANPHNILGAQLGLTDAAPTTLAEHRVEFALSQYNAASNTWTWKKEANWWLSKLRKSKDDNYQHLELEINDFYHRLENPFRDAIVIPGQFLWTDWQPAGTNQITKYHNDTDIFQSYSPAGADENTIPRLLTVTSGEGAIPGITPLSITKFAGDIFENVYITVMLHTDGGLVFRYNEITDADGVDQPNFYYVKFKSATVLALYRYVNGQPTLLAYADPAPTGSVPITITVNVRWGKIEITTTAGASLTYTLEQEPLLMTGFVGFVSTEISNLIIREYHMPMNTKDLLRVLLAYADEHDITIELDEETAAAAQLDWVWGPLGDADTPDKAFRQLIEAGRIQTVWLED